MGALTGKTALVTGGSRGIGRAIAGRLAADGARVAVHYGSNGAAAKNEEGLGGQPLDIVVNNAGGSMGTGSIERTTPQGFHRMLALNLRAPFFIIQRALPLLRDGGRIINISSADTRIAIARELAYSMAQGAINVLGRTLAQALGERGITVNTVAPGATDTEPNAWMHASHEMEALVASASALGRIGQPADVAAVVAFLASDDARWVTGHLLDASGGAFLDLARR
jgi:3-oxoacyl-[acyl-carrier protein] reductase